MFVKMFDRNFKVMLSSLMIKIIGVFVNLCCFGMWVFFPLVCSLILGKRDEIYSTNNVTSFVHTCWICAYLFILFFYRVLLTCIGVFVSEFPFY